MLSSSINNKDSVHTGAKHGNYGVKVHSEKYSTWYIKYEKYSMSLLMPKQTELRDDIGSDSHVTALWTVHILKNVIYFRPIVLQALISVIKSMWLAFKICWTRVVQNFFMKNFDLVLLNKLTYSLSSGPLYTSMC